MKSTMKPNKRVAIEGEASNSKERESFYFPGCRKDANCDCNICLDSINATLDLMPMSSLTKLSTSKPAKPATERTPVSIDPTLLSTPESRTPISHNSDPTPLRSTAKTKLAVKSGSKKRELGKRMDFLKWGLWVGLILGVEFGVNWVISGVLRPRLSDEVVREVGLKFAVVENLNEKLKLLQKELEGRVDGKISGCVLGKSVWKINQNGLLLNSRCIMHKSAAEEVSIWGWPLQSAGLLTAGFSSASFTLLSGRLTEWSDGRTEYQIRKVNTTWTQRTWSASAVQLDPQTWILEYKRSVLVENPSIITAASEFLKFRMSVLIRRMKLRFWNFLPLLDNQSCFSTPT